MEAASLHVLRKPGVPWRGETPEPPVDAASKRKTLFFTIFTLSIWPMIRPPSENEILDPHYPQQPRHDHLSHLTGTRPLSQVPPREPARTPSTEAATSSRFVRCPSA